MDCRHYAARVTLPCIPFLALSMMVGCDHFKGATLDMPLPSAEALPAALKSDKSKKRDFSPAGLVSIGDFRTLTARDPNVSSADKQYFREQGRKVYQRAIKLDPKFLAAYVGLGRLYQDLQEHERAVATYRAGLKELPKSAVLWYELGMCQAKKKEWDQAITSLRSAHELDPENRVYVNTMGFTMARAGRIDESYAFFEKEMGEARAHYNLARMLRHLSEPEQCKEHVQRALQVKPDMEEARQLLAELENPPPPTSEGTEAQISFEGPDDLPPATTNHK